MRILIAEDNTIVAALLEEILSHEEDMTVVGIARDGADAVELTKRLRPDVVTMDINMPEKNGLEATKEIMGSRPTPIVIVSGVVDRNDVDFSMAALEAGALAVLPKPPSPMSRGFDSARRELVGTVRSMADVLVVHRRRTSTGIRARVQASSSRSVDIVGIAASTGGPAAIGEVLARLRADFPVPILVVQHIADGFVEGLARRMDATTALVVQLAQEGMKPQPGHVYYAPDQKHLGVRGGVLTLAAGESGDRFVPSADRLFRSLAVEYGRSAIGVLLTGMGDDGTEGMSVMKKVGALTMAQDRETSVVFGMPRAAIEAGAVEHVLPLDEIGLYLDRFVRRRDAR
jgi:two-component system chemotaxis response regulator CheB